jgi:hypothetical protein
MLDCEKRRGSGNKWGIGTGDADFLGLWIDIYPIDEVSVTRGGGNGAGAGKFPEVGVHCDMPDLRLDVMVTTGVIYATTEESNDEASNYAGTCASG